jgi:hypothetical protein
MKFSDGLRSLRAARRMFEARSCMRCTNQVCRAEACRLLFVLIALAITHDNRIVAAEMASGEQLLRLEMRLSKIQKFRGNPLLHGATERRRFLNSLPLLCNLGRDWLCI